MKKLFLIIISSAIALTGSATKPDTDQPYTDGDFQATWESLAQWECPEWYKDAKFGIWAHWGPQCQAEDGDWYARHMYYPGFEQYNWHVKHFGHPASFGLKDLCNAWKAENWNPKELVKLYKSVGARYFMTLANHHDNFDLWDSPYQEWNSVNIGPQRDIVKEWSEACREAGLPLGVSVHASHAWSWLEPSQAFDGNLTYDDGFKPNADGSNKWWKGYDPQELYAQRHPHSSGWDNSGSIHAQWDWGNGCSIPDEEYRKKLMNRTLQLVYDYSPDMIYFDDTALPFYGCDEQWGLDFLSSYYNFSAKAHGGQQQVVVTGKQLEPHIKNAMLWDVERGIPDRAQPAYWQTCTCIGDWHYNQAVYNENRYKSASTVVKMLIDVVSKNGNLLLSIPVKGDGTIDDKERLVLAGIKAWMDINSGAIYATRPWKTFGEGPLAEADNPMNAQGFNEGLNYTAADIRFTQKNDTIFAFFMGWPESADCLIKSFSKASETYSGNVTSVKLLGYGDVEYSHDIDGLHITLPESHPNEISPVFAITTDGASVTSAERLQALIDIVSDYLASVKESLSYINTGKYNLRSCDRLSLTLDEVNRLADSASDTETQSLIDRLQAAYNDFKSAGTNPGGLYRNINDCKRDVTTDYLVERSSFARSEGTGRFGRPANWTVENYRIPNGSDGIKQGLDRYSGSDALSLGLWNDRDKNTDGNLANARIYRKITLPRGLYFFGAVYNTTYNITDRAYMFVSKELAPTSTLTETSEAYFPIAECAESTNDFYGLKFFLEEEQEVYIGWQADLAQGSDTQEFRATRVVLLQLSECNSADVATLIEEITSELSSASVGPNSGQYPHDAFEAISDEVDNARSSLDSADNSTLTDLYFLLTQQWQDFLNSRIGCGIETADFGTDLTIPLLVEASDFATTSPLGSHRFGKPLHWTVENFSIDRGDEGLKQGIDAYSGQNSLMLGVWEDKFKNSEGTLTNSRIYRKVTLQPGSYYFGARYNALYQMHRCYMFASPAILPTTDITTKSLAWCNINEARIDDSHHGIYFTVTTPGDYYIGWQANLLEGPTCQEFRADNLLLVKKESASAETISIDQIPTKPDFTRPYSIYNLQGIRITNPLPGHIYIVAQNTLTWKIRF